MGTRPPGPAAPARPITQAAYTGRQRGSMLAVAIVGAALLAAAILWIGPTRTTLSRRPGGGSPAPLHLAVLPPYLARGGPSDPTLAHEIHRGLVRQLGCMRGAHRLALTEVDARLPPEDAGHVGSWFEGADALLATRLTGNGSEITLALTLRRQGTADSEAATELNASRQQRAGLPAQAARWVGQQLGLPHDVVKRALTDCATG